MAMGIPRGKAEINVTPMIDVLLVLLIIFMVVLPERSVGLNVQVPQESGEGPSVAGYYRSRWRQGAAGMNRTWL